MFDYDDTEAAHLSEIYDDYGYDVKEPLSREKRADYVEAKSRCFQKSDIGKYVVVQTPRKNKGVVRRLYLVDRKVTKSCWWSPSAFLAMVFEKESAATIQAKKYKYNKARVMQITKSMADISSFLEEYEND